MSTPIHITLPTSDAPQLPEWLEVTRSVVASEAEMDALAARLSQHLRPGDILLLSGGVGAGKTHLARALIRAWLKAPDEPVPSPTFTLVETYSFDSLEALNEAMSSSGMQEVAADANRISTGGAPTILIGKLS